MSNSLLIENDSSNVIKVELGSTQTLETNSSASFKFNNDKLIISNSLGSITINAKEVIKLYSQLIVIDNANNQYTDFSATQALGVNTSTGFPTAPTLYVSILPSPGYFLTISGPSPGTFSQVDSSPYLVSSATQAVQSVHWLVWTLLIVVLCCILGGLVFFAYMKKKKINS